ncbi:ABC transporter permease [Pseudonocardia sp. RS010]|uniref:ABC transporter permease n=1 Tax=Pseudonocardia sp. RS010 TaxID=3385979 RepID=UPI0039A0A835
MTRLAVSLHRYGVQVAILLVVLVVLTTTSTQFRGPSAAFSTLEGFGLLGIVALGVAVTMIAGELDLSAASMTTLGSVIAVRASDLGLLPAILAAVAVCLLIGLVHGLVIARTGINSLVLTIGSLVLLQGIAWVASGEGPVVVTDYAVSDQVLLRWWILSPSSVIALVVFVGVGVFLAKTRNGREIYAIGGGRKESLAAGVPLARPLTTAFAISGACAGLAGALAAMRSGSATPDAFETLLLTGVAAALIGGIALSGGSGTVLNVAIGVAVLSLITAGFSAQGAATYVVQLWTGVVLIATIAIRLVLGLVRTTHTKTGDTT